MTTARSDSGSQDAPTLRPLADLRVLEVGSDMAVAFGCRLLADLGAEVIKTEPPGGGDHLRREGPYAGAPGMQEATALFGYLNSGKRSVTVDCGSPSGDRLIARLVEICDLVVWAPQGTPSPTLQSIFDGSEEGAPPLIAMTPFGIRGPGAERVGGHFIVQHSSGFALHQASPVTDPANTPPVACADREAALTSGLVVGISALWALDAARGARTGPVVDLSAEDVFAYMLVEPYAEATGDSAEFTRQREPGSGTAVVGGLVWYLPCADGAILVSPREDHQWANWVEVMGTPEWTKDLELCGSRPIRTKNAERLQELMAEWSVTQKAEEVFVAAQEKRVACFPMSSGEDLLSNRQLQHRGFFSTLKQADGQIVCVPGLPFQMRDGAGRVLEKNRTTETPGLGEANGMFLGEMLNLAEAETEALARYRIV